jgi:hypothetical protein
LHFLEKSAQKIFKNLKNQTLQKVSNALFEDFWECVITVLIKIQLKIIVVG